MSRLQTLFDPPRFQSANRKGGWFEGWYFKLVGPDGKNPIAVIPGVSNDPEGGTSHSFVQLIRPGGAVRYISMPFDAFSWRDDRFEVRVGDCLFSSAGVELDLPATDDGPAVKGAVRFGPLSQWPVTTMSPGIMGWYRYVPFMECYHGVVSMDHSLDGSLAWGAESLDFTQGRGYAEKDWGTGFPSSWLWAQSNHFEDPAGVPTPGVSLSCSVARIPWLGSSFVGHIAGLLIEGRLLRFTTYTGARLTELSFRTGGAHLVFEDKAHRLSIEVDGAVTGALKAPQHGKMTARADEALDASVRVLLSDRSGTTLFEGTGKHAGVEIMNQRDELYARHQR